MRSGVAETYASGRFVMWNELSEKVLHSPASEECPSKVLCMMERLLPTRRHSHLIFSSILNIYSILSCASKKILLLSTSNQS
jgi:hypothetical protein